MQRRDPGSRPTRWTRYWSMKADPLDRAAALRVVIDKSASPEIEGFWGLVVKASGVLPFHSFCQKHWHIRAFWIRNNLF